VTNEEKPQDGSRQDDVSHDVSPTTSPGTGGMTIEIITVSEFTAYFIKRGLTLLEAVALWDELEAADITAPESTEPVVRVHGGVTYELTFEWSGTNDQTVVAVAARSCGDR
jgi:hypothetical protein